MTARILTETRNGNPSQQSSSSKEFDPPHHLISVPFAATNLTFNATTFTLTTIKGPYDSYYVDPRSLKDVYS